MIKSSSYDSLQIAYDFMERARQLTDRDNYDEAYVALKRAESYAFNNPSLLDSINVRREAIDEARQKYINSLEEKAANIFSSDQFDGQAARAVLQALQRHDSDNELAKILWADLPTKETAERERQLVREFQIELAKIWEQAQKLESMGAGTRAVDEYERALDEALKKAGNAPDSIPLQRLKMETMERRDRAKAKWIGTPTLILDRKGQELVARYEALKEQGRIESEFFDENGEFLGKLPIDECISRAKQMASGFAAQKAQDYLGRAHELLQESPGAAYEKIQDALSLAYLSDFVRNRLEQELRNTIEPAVQQRQKALNQLKSAMSKTDPEEAWLLLADVEQIDPFTPNLEDAHQRLFPMMLQKFSHLIDAGQRLQELEDFEAARVNLQKAINVAQRFSTYGEEFQGLLPRAQEALNECAQAEKVAQEFDRPLQEIARQIETEPDLARQQLEQLVTQEPPPQILAKIKRLRVQADFRLGVEQLFSTIEQKMLSAEDDVALIPVEEAAKQAIQDYPREKRFQQLLERIIARRHFLKGRRLRNDPSRWLEAKDMLQKVVSRDSDDASTAQTLMDEITADEEQEADITIAVQQADIALSSGDPRLTFLLLEPYRYAVSPQASEVQQLISTAVTLWREQIDQELEATIASGRLVLPKVEQLIGGLEHSQSPRLEEWNVRALAPALAKAAQDLQELSRWDRANELWERAFRLAPGNPLILEGRRNAQKQRALLQAQMSFDPQEKEQILNDLKNTYVDDLMVRRHLAEFYYAEERYAETRIAVTQAIFLSKHTATAESIQESESIQKLDALLQEVEEIEKQKLSIESRLAGNTSLGSVGEAQATYRQLLQAFPNHRDRLEGWWMGLTKKVVDEMKTRIAALAEEAGTLWERTELSCKILALQDDAQVREQAVRMLKLAYSQLPAEIQAVVDNPTGAGFGPASEALKNHAAKARTLYNRLVNISQVERLSSKLGLTSVERTIDIETTLYQLGLVIEKLSSVQEKQREIQSQIIAAMMTGEWTSIGYGLQELQQMGLGEYLGMKELAEEAEKAKRKRADLELAIAQIQEAMREEEFLVVQERLRYLRQLDPADETRLQATLEVVDPYSGQRIKGHKELGQLVAEKLTTLDLVTEWEKERNPTVDWNAARTKIAEFAHGGAFTDAIQFCQKIMGSDDLHPSVSQEEPWSLRQVLRFLATPPIAMERINSARTQALLNQVDQEIQTLTDQIEQSDLLVKELGQREEEFSQLLRELWPLLEQLKNVRGLFGALRKPAAEVHATKIKATELFEKGHQLCPGYPGFGMVRRILNGRV